MITPYKNGKVDYAAAEQMVEWYWKQGCDGIFAVCLSSEILWLTLEERVGLAKAVIQTARRLAETDHSRPPMMIVASGHISDRFEDQVTELNAIAAEKPDALILISNRMDVAQTTDERWIEDAERLISKLPPELPLGIYESPLPYKRVLSEKIVRWCAKNERFHFIKDTCCELELIRQRLEWCQGSQIKLFNANAQTLLKSMEYGVSGYCGVMANFHPDLYVKLLQFRKTDPEKASLLQDFLCVSTLAETMTYPCSAKYYLDKYEGISMDVTSRMKDCSLFTDYQKHCVDQFAELTAFARKQLTAFEKKELL